MAMRSCPKCGAPLQFSTQKFCTTCGATVPEQAPVQTPAPGAVFGMVLGLIIIVGVLALGAGAFLLYPHITGTAGTTSVAPAGSSGDPVTPLPTSPSGTTVLTMTPIRTTSTPVTSAPTTKPAVAPTKTVTMTIPTTTRTPTPVPATTVPTPTPEPKQTSVIRLDVTRAPEQPPVSSYTSSTPGAPYIDPSALEMRIHELTNAQRVQNGLSELSYDSFLADIARGHSWDMVQRNFFEHMNPDGKLARDRGNDAGYPCIIVVKGGSYNGIAENLLEG